MPLSGKKVVPLPAETGQNQRFEDMFKKTKSPESTLFESPSNLMRGRALKKYDDTKAWHSQFYEDNGMLVAGIAGCIQGN